MGKEELQLLVGIAAAAETFTESDTRASRHAKIVEVTWGEKQLGVAMAVSKLPAAKTAGVLRMGRANARRRISSNLSPG